MEEKLRDFGPKDNRDKPRNKLNTQISYRLKGGGRCFRVRHAI